MEYGHFQNPSDSEHVCYRMSTMNELNHLYGGHAMYLSRPTSSDYDSMYGAISNINGPFAVLVKTNEVSGNDILSELLICDEYGIVCKTRIVTGNVTNSVTYNNIVFGGFAYYYDSSNSHMRIVIPFFASCDCSNDTSLKMKIVRFECDGDSSLAPYRYSLSEGSLEPISEKTLSTIYTRSSLTSQFYTYMLDSDRLVVRCAMAEGGAYAVGATGLSGSTINSILTEATYRQTLIPEMTLFSYLDTSGYIHMGNFRKDGTTHRYYLFDDKSLIQSQTMPKIPLSAYNQIGTNTDSVYNVESTCVTTDYIQDASSHNTKFLCSSMCFNGSGTYPGESIGRADLSGGYVIWTPNGDTNVARLGSYASLGSTAVYEILMYPFSYPVNTTYNDYDPYVYGFQYDGNLVDSYGDVKCMWTYCPSRKVLECVSLLTS